MNLEKSINKLLYSTTINELSLMTNKFLSEDITYNSILYLDIIGLTENCTVTKLSEMLKISKPAVTAKVNELIKKGFVLKKQSTEDKRVYYLMLTNQNKKIHQKYDKATSKTIEFVKNKYSKSEITTFCEVLESFNNFYFKEINNGK
ncbi:MAG: MarR family transcriptional regulator [Oscillospiraceae bacterium]